MEKLSSISSNPLEQFILLAKSAKGAAAVDIVKRALETPGIYVFGELLEISNIQELQHGEFAPYWDLLNIFAYGTFEDYKKNHTNLPPVTQSQLDKLRHLTIVTLAAKSKYIAYSDLLQELHIQDLRQLEDLIIEVIYADVISGKLDQMNQRLEVDFGIGRDIKPELLPCVINTLQEWCDTCYAVLDNTEQQITIANTARSQSLSDKTQLDAEISKLRNNIKTLAAAGATNDDMGITSDASGYGTSGFVSGDKGGGGKKQKIKGLRGSGKLSHLWNK